MLETKITLEKIREEFNYHDLTPFEHVLIGSSTEIIVNESKIFVNSEAFKDLRRDNDAWATILTPINLSRGKKTIEEILKARKQADFLSGMALTMFEFEPQWSYIERGIHPSFKPGELDQNGQLKTFGIFFLQNNKILIPSNLEMEMPIHEDFSNLIRYVGKENQAMKFEIKK